MQKLSWQDGVPVSEQFGDVYFSLNDGLKETEYVFLQGNKLEERFKETQNFTIIETGFGTGLNFLATLRLWQQAAQQESQLHFISVEKFPLTKKDLEKAHNFWPELKEFSEMLLQVYPSPPEESCTLNISNNCKLTLLFSDVNEALPTVKEEADAWFLDGFSPAKNPEMWNDELYQNMFNLSKDETTLATFTAAGHVRQGLENAGFEIKRIKGYGYKRHMITGQKAPSTHPLQP